MEIGLDKCEDLFLIVTDVGAESAVIEGSETGNDSVDHRGGEDAFSLVDAALFGEAISTVLVNAGYVAN